MPLLLILVLFLPAVQAKLVAIAEHMLQEKTGIEMTVGAVRISPLFNVALDDVLALDQNRDTLLHCSRIVLDTDIMTLRDSMVNVNEFRMTDVALDTRSMLGETAVKGRIDKLYIRSDSTSLKDRYTLLNTLNIKGADLALAQSPKEDDENGTLPEWRFTAPDISLEDVKFTLLPTGPGVNLAEIRISASGDISKMTFNIDKLNVRSAEATLDGKTYVLDSLRTFGSLNGTDVTLPFISAHSGSVNLDGNASFDLSEPAATSIYDIALNLKDFNLKDFIDTGQNCAASGTVKVKGHGFDPMSNGTLMNLSADLQDARWDDIRLSKTNLTAKVGGGSANGKIRTSGRLHTDSLDISTGAAIDFISSSLSSKRPKLKADIDLRDVTFKKDTLALAADSLRLNLQTEPQRTALTLGTTGLQADASSESHLLDLLPKLQDLANSLPKDLNDIDLSKLKRHFPPLQMTLDATSGNPLQDVLDDKGISFSTAKLKAFLSEKDGLTASFLGNDLRKDTLSLRSVRLDLKQREDVLDCTADAEIPAQIGIPEVRLALDGWTDGYDGKMHMRAHSNVTDGIMSLDGISADASADINVLMDSRTLSATGAVILGDLTYQSHNFDDRYALISMKPAEGGEYDINVTTDNVPLPIFMSYIDSEDISLEGEITAKMNLHGPLDSLSMTMEATPRGGIIHYKPYKAVLTLAEDKILLEDMLLKVPGMRIYGVDSTMAMMTGGIDLTKENIDFSIVSDRFKPAPFAQDDSTAYYGNVAAAIALKVHGNFEEQFVDGDIDILPETDIIYSLGSKNFVHAKASGHLLLDFPLQGELGLKGRINIDSGEIKYTLPFYPIAPFKIDKGSHVDFDGPISNLKMDVTAMQKARATVSDTGDRSRSVDFNVGLRITDSFDNLGLHFLMDAPYDIAIQNEIEQMSVEEKDRIAAALLATGMYTSDTNAEIFQTGYALTSILQHSLNSIAANKLGKIVDVDLGMSGTSNYDTYTSKYSMRLSKTFLDDRLKITVGGTLASNTSDVESYSSAFLDNVSASYLFGEKKRTAVTLFHKRDFENIVDGELNKEGIEVKTSLELPGKDVGESPYLLDLGGDVSYRSNRQLGPSLAAMVTKNNLLGKGETLSAKLHGAYYFKVADRNAGGNDNSNIGLDLAMTVPSDKKSGTSSRYKFGYLHENIGGANRLDKFSLGMDYLFRTGPFTSHEFAPFDLSIFNSNPSDKYFEEAISIHQLINSFIHDEYIPAVKYRFNYDNSADRDRAVKTRFSFGATESGNVISGLQAVLGKDFNEKEKKFLFGSYDQFVRFDAELRNNFPVGKRNHLATRVFAGAAFPYGNSESLPLSQNFYVGGPTSLRGFAPRSIGPGGFYSPIYDLYFYHGGDLRGEVNVEYRFPLFWMLEGAAFVEAGNVWMTSNTADALTDEEKELLKILQIPYDYVDALRWNSLLSTTALNTGLGVRLIYQTIVIRLDLGIPLHYPYDTGVNAYYNIPSFREGFRLNFGIGYPF